LQRVWSPSSFVIILWLTLIDSFGFAKYFDVRDAELCIRGFYKLGYEVGFARVCESYLKSEYPLTTLQESFNSRLKAEGDENSTNLYVSNLPRDMTEAVSNSLRNLPH
jgi:hypothetical protein